MKNCTGERCIMQYDKVEPATCKCVSYCQNATPPITNADRIRAMTDEELARYMAEVQIYRGCPNNGAIDCHENCAVCWLGWLRQEATE